MTITKSHRRILPFLSFFLVILLGLYVFYANIEIQQIKDEKQKELSMLKQNEWDFIVGVIKENTDKAYLLSQKVRDNIEKDLLAAYKGNMEQLKEDMDSTSSETQFSKILRKNIEGVYLNVKNDNNDPWAATLKGIRTDLSENCAKLGSQTRDFKTEVNGTNGSNGHANKVAAWAAIQKVVNQDTSDIFGWEYLKSSNPAHIMLKDVSLDTLKTVFMKEGVAGLSTYEFLNPTYITDNSDIFGVPNISNNGNKMTNYKLIIVEGFNVVDELNLKHSVALNNYDNEYRNIIEECQNRQTTKEIMYIGFSACLLLTFLGIIKIQNMAYSLEE